MRIAIQLVVEMTDDQVKDWAGEYGLAVSEAGKVMAKDIVADVRSYALTALQGSTLGEFAEISIKER